MLAELVLGAGSVSAALVGTFGLSQAAHSDSSHPRTVIAAPCSSDDGSGPDPCYWNAKTMGNGSGRSYVMVHGVQHDAVLPYAKWVHVGSTYYRIGG